MVILLLLLLYYYYYYIIIIIITIIIIYNKFRGPVCFLSFLFQLISPWSANQST